MANMKQLYEDTAKTVEAYPRVWLPVGSLYWNENDISTEISKYFVGTWQRVKDVFILAAGDTYAAKSSGGKAYHSHLYRVGYRPYFGALVGDDNNAIQLYDYVNQKWVTGAKDAGMPKDSGSNGGLSTVYDNTKPGTAYSVGANTTDTNSMPPYYTAYCWKRIS